uniref:Na_Ca_ex domain-containing protein n=1 Tax=Ascaris lumbricoides TaxID=6252 RepID=A0A0M3IK71_ASCLU
MVVFSVMGISDCVAVVRWVRREDLLEAGDSSCVASGANSCIILICVLPGTFFLFFFISESSTDNERLLSGSSEVA